MKSTKANKMIQAISKSIAENGIDTENLIPQLQELRELAKQEEDPLLIRCIRMAYEHLENEDTWSYPVIRAEEPEEGEEPEEEEEYTSVQHFDYLLTLWEKSDNKYNRDEMRRVANDLQDF
jgi:CO dehydrogenase/acetyl-CoA synthase beta subunit